MSGRSRDPEIREMKRHILRYLEKHPEAGDTLQGIVSWWVAQQWTSRQVGAIVSAVEELTARGLLVEVHRPGVGPHYRLNPGSLDEIRRLLREDAE